MVRVRCDAILFDLDGVLIDSTPAVARVWTKWATEHGFDPKTVVRHAHGRPSIATVEAFLPQADLQAENLKLEQAEIEDLDGVVPLPGAKELLDALPPERWTIVTSGTRPLAEVRLRAAGLQVPQRMVTASDITNGKPDAEPYLKGAAALGLAAEDCMVIEDAPAGVRSGKTAGAAVLAVRTTLSEGELRAAGADWVVDDCRNVQVFSDSRGLLVQIT